MENRKGIGKFMITDEPNPYTGITYKQNMNVHN